MYIYSFCRYPKHLLSVTARDQGNHIIAMNWSRCDCLWRLRFVRSTRQESWRGTSLVSYWCAHYCHFHQAWTVSVEQAHFHIFKLACMEHKNRFLSITLPQQCAFRMSFSSLSVSGIKSHYNTEWEDNHTLKRYLSIKSFVAEVFESGLCQWCGILKSVCRSQVHIAVCTCTTWIQMVYYGYGELNDNTCCSCS